MDFLVDLIIYFSFICKDVLIGPQEASHTTMLTHQKKNLLNSLSLTIISMNDSTLDHLSIAVSS